VSATRALLVRHGQSTWNAERRWQGRADPPLSDLGRRQAHAAVPAVAAEGVQLVWCSPLRRARETAEIIGAELSVEVVVHPGLVERDAGEWTGLTRAEIEARWPGHLERGLRPSGYEPDEEVVRRAEGALRAVAEEVDGATGLVVTHGGLIRAIERHLGVDGDVVPNLAGRALERAGTRWRAGSRVVLCDGSVPLTRPRQL
jgi:probable phosphoglycerate mutase